MTFQHIDNEIMNVDVYEVIDVRICSSSHNFYVFGVYRNPDLSDKIFYCWFSGIAKVQSVARKASFLLVSDVNANHEEWLGSSTINLHCKAARDFASSSG